MFKIYKDDVYFWSLMLVNFWWYFILKNS